MSLTSPTAAPPNPADDHRVYTLADLQSWERIRPGLPPSLAVLGHPVAHSVSPQMHNAALAELGKRHPQLKDWRYFKFDIEPNDLGQALDMMREKGFKGINLTLPHKTVVEKHLPNASVTMTGTEVLNTLFIKGDGWHGRNTDEYGLEQALQKSFSVLIKDTPIVILGAGGAAWSAAMLCLRFGCPNLWIGNRDPKNRQQFLQKLAQFYGRPSQTVHPFDIQSPHVEEWPDNVLVINSTSLGLQSGDPLPFDVKQLPRNAMVFDMVYGRENMTPFALAAKAQGLRAVDGLEMLVWQGAASLCIWLENALGISIKPEDVADIMSKAARAALGREL